MLGVLGLGERLVAVSVCCIVWWVCLLGGVACGVLPL